MILTKKCPKKKEYHIIRHRKDLRLPERLSSTLRHLIRLKVGEPTFLYLPTDMVSIMITIVSEKTYETYSGTVCHQFRGSFF